MLRQRPQNHIRLLNFFISFDNCKILSVTYLLNEAEKKITNVCSFLRVSKILWFYIDLGGAVWILNHVSRSITWSLFTLEATNLVKWPLSTWSFTWWCQFIDWLRFETHYSSLHNSGMAYRLALQAWIKIFFNTQWKYFTTCTLAFIFIWVILHWRKKIVFLQNLVNIVTYCLRLNKVELINYTSRTTMDRRVREMLPAT